MKKGTGLIAAGIAAFGIWALARTAAGGQVFICPYCDGEFGTYDELAQHIEEYHGKPPPPPPTEPPLDPEIRVSIAFDREAVCAEGHMDGNTWVCTQYFGDERTGTITVKNEKAPARLTIIVEGWLYLEGVEHNHFIQREWVADFESGQSSAYSFNYMIPHTGMPMDSRFFIAVYDEAYVLVAEKSFVKSL